MGRVKEIITHSTAAFIFGFPVTIAMSGEAAYAVPNPAPTDQSTLAPDKTPAAPVSLEAQTDRYLSQLAGQLEDLHVSHAKSSGEEPVFIKHHATSGVSNSSYEVDFELYKDVKDETGQKHQLGIEATTNGLKGSDRQLIKLKMTDITLQEDPTGKNPISRETIVFVNTFDYEPKRRIIIGLTTNPAGIVDDRLLLGHRKPGETGYTGMLPKVGVLSSSNGVRNLDQTRFVRFQIASNNFVKDFEKGRVPKI